MSQQSPEQNATNLILNNTPSDLMKVDFNEITKRAREHVDKVNAANPKPIDAEWRSELEQLERWVPHTATESGAKEYAARKESENLSAVKEIERQIAAFRKLLDEPYLEVHQGFDPKGEPKVAEAYGNKMTGRACGCNGCAILRNIERAQFKLGMAKKQLERDTHKCGLTIKAAREADKLRPRLKELREREARIRYATRRGKPIDTPFEQEEPSPAPLGRSKYIKWE